MLDRARTREDQQRCVTALERKCEILWRMLDCIEAAHAKPKPSPHAKLRTGDAEAAALVVLPERAVKLNESGREILALCDGERSAEAIAAELRSRHPEAVDIEADVHAFLAQMQSLGVLTGARSG